MNNQGTERTRKLLHEPMFDILKLYAQFHDHTISILQNLTTKSQQR
jgi:hypothetical protein